MAYLYLLDYLTILSIVTLTKVPEADQGINKKIQLKWSQTMVDPFCDPFCDHNRIIFNMNTVFCLTIVKGLVKLSIVLIILEILIILIIINIMPKKLWLFWRRCVPLGWGGRAPSKQGRSPRCESIYTTNYFFASSKKVFIVIKILLTQKPFIVSHWNFKIFFSW